MRRLFERFLPVNHKGNEPKHETRVIVGIAAMDKKAKSKQMNQILHRLKAYGEFEIIIYGDETILHKPIEEWPLCDCLLSWHSDGFPLDKAQAYARLRNPFCVNDLPQQYTLLDRTQVYRTLVAQQIPVPKHIIVVRDGLSPGEDPEGFVETEDYVELNGVRINKPFVEKPEYAENHNIWIYYPFSMGGGVKRLFRKVNDKSSHYDSQHSGAVRRDGNYIYEEFLTTGGTDVKVYTVGPRYAHAEARKSPVVDGKVLRTADGKEMRFPVLLTPQEKEIARQVVLAFNQNVCGFDLLRSEKGKSYVCDVNGWSFVKNSKRYYDDSAGILRSMILGAVAPHHLAATPTPDVTFPSVSASAHKHAHSQSHLYGLEQDDAALLMDADEPDVGLEGELASCIDDSEIARTDQRSESDELRCVLAVIRHGDRTPKQKLKLHTTAEPLLSLFHKYKDAKGKQAKLKSPGQLQELLNITRQLLQSLEKTQEENPLPIRASSTTPQQAWQTDKLGSINSSDATASNAAAATATTAGADAAAAGGGVGGEDDANAELREKLRIVRTVLEQASFNGINRKVQIKPTKWRSVAPQPEAVGEGSSATGGDAEGGPKAAAPQGTTDDKADPAAKEHKEQQPAQQLEEALLVCKWGGVLTHAGRQQAEDLGKVFRLVMYPRYGSAGGGLLRLHSTYRHDLKIYSSDEGRVQASAAAFAKGLLDLEGTSLTPILVSLVKKDASMLDAFGKGASEDIQRAKDAVYRTLTHDPDKDSPAPKRDSGVPTPVPSASPTAPSHPAPLSGSPPTQASAGATESAQPAEQPGHGTSPFSGQHQESAASANEAGLGGAGGGKDGNGLAEGGSEARQISSIHVPKQPGKGRAAEEGQPGTDGAPAPQPASVPGIRGMPDQPLALLRRLVELMKVLVSQLRELCLHEKVEPGSHTSGAGIGARYSSLSHEPRSEWQLEPGKPCSGERMLLMFDRWRKLLKSFYSEKKGTFDISKIPDIYDSAKYDANHNGHLNLNLRELYIVSRQLATAVIPNEYGIDPQGKLRIGSRIASELLGKLLVDLDAMREESVSTLRQEEEEEERRRKEVLASRLGASPHLRTPMNLRRHSIASASVTPPTKRDGSGSISRLSANPHLKEEATPGASAPAFPAGPGSGPLPTIHAAGAAGGGVGVMQGPPGAKPSPGTAFSGGGGVAAATAAAAATGSYSSSNDAYLEGCLPQGGSPAAGEGVGEGSGAKGGKEGEEAGEGGQEEGVQGVLKEGDSDEEVEVEETIHRLCPDYARETINSPLRHVRTRIYFTSESHIHSLVNVLRLCHLSRTQEQPSLSQTCTEPLSTGGSYDATQHQGGPHPQQGDPQQQQQQQQPVPHKPGCMGSPLLSPEACAMLDNTTELDYLTHVVFRMYENKAVPVTAPERFRVEILFSPGAVGDPFQVAAERSRAASLSTKLSRELGGAHAQGATDAAGAGGSAASTPKDLGSGGDAEHQPAPAAPEGSGDADGSSGSSAAAALAEGGGMPGAAAPGAEQGVGRGSAGGEGQREGCGKEGRPDAQRALAPAPLQPQHEYVSVSRPNSTSGSVKLKPRLSCSTPCQAEDGEALGSGGGALGSQSPKVKSKCGSIVDEAEASGRPGKARSSSIVNSRRVSQTGGGDDSEGESQAGSMKRRSMQLPRCCRGPAWHVLPVAPRTVLHDGHRDGIALEALEETLGPMAKVQKFAPPAYAAALYARIHGHPPEGREKAGRPPTPSVNTQ